MVIEKKIKIGIHLPNRDIPGVRLADPEKGNPGIGGTQFLMFAFPHYLNKYFPDKYEFLILADLAESVETEFGLMQVDNLSDAALKAKDNNCSMLIFRPIDNKEVQVFLEKLKELQLKAIAWMHNTPYFMLNHLFDNEYVIRCLCVGRIQYETMRDHNIIDKLSMIYNGVDFNNVAYADSIPKTKSVVFLGSLIFAKGFHIIARQWKKILKVHPDARLLVIGTGKLYERNMNLGSLGLSDSKYEKMFSRFILNKEGKVLESVKFLGVMGPEKYEVLSQASVGIVSHPFLRENLPIAAIEVQLCGTPVVNSSFGGLLDIVKDEETGYLKNSKRGRLKSIVKLLGDPEMVARMGAAGKKLSMEKFNYKLVTEEWSSLIYDVMHDRPVQILPLNKNKHSKLDLIRERIRILKSRNKIFGMLIPSIYVIHTFESIRINLNRIIG